MRRIGPKSLAAGALVAASAFACQRRTLTKEKHAANQAQHGSVGESYLVTESCYRQHGPRRNQSQSTQHVSHLAHSTPRVRLPPAHDSDWC